MIIHNCKQGTPEWDVLRLGSITASRFKDVLSKGKGRSNYLSALLTEITTGKKEEHYINAAMLDGMEKEPYARYRYAKLFGCNVQEVGFCEMNSMVGVSPDSLVDDDGLVEIKCPLKKTFLKYQASPKALVSAYKWQVQGQLWVTGRKWCDLFAWRPEEEKDYVCIRVERNKKDIMVLKAGVDQFLKELQEKLESI